MSHTLTIDAHGTSPALPTTPVEPPAETTTLPTAAEAEVPRVLDTYALLYALTLVFLVPGAASIAKLPFHDYTFAYVSLVVLPGLLGLLAVLLTDSRDSLKAILVRIAILGPLIALTGVTVLFTSTLVVLPIGQVLTPARFGIAGPLATIILVALALPLLPTLVRSLRLPLGWRSVLHIIALLFAIAVVIGVVVLTLRPDRTLATFERKDATIFIVGALAWYLPAFGISAGIWRRLGLV